MNPNDLLYTQKFINKNNLSKKQIQNDAQNFYMYENGWNSKQQQ